MHARACILAPTGSFLQDASFPIARCSFQAPLLTRGFLNPLSDKGACNLPTRRPTEARQNRVRYPAVELTGEGRPYPPRVEANLNPGRRPPGPPGCSHRPPASCPAIPAVSPPPVLIPSSRRWFRSCGHQRGAVSRFLCGVQCGRNSVGRVSAFQADCRGFESRRPLQRAQALTVFRFSSHSPQGPCSSAVEHVIGNDGVTSSILVKGSTFTRSFT